MFSVLGVYADAKGKGEMEGLGRRDSGKLMGADESSSVDLGSDPNLELPFEASAAGVKKVGKEEGEGSGVDLGSKPGMELSEGTVEGVEGATVSEDENRLSRLSSCSTPR